MSDSGAEPGKANEVSHDGLRQIAKAIESLADEITGQRQAAQRETRWNNRAAIGVMIYTVITAVIMGFTIAQTFIARNQLNIAVSEDRGYIAPYQLSVEYLGPKDGGQNWSDGGLISISTYYKNVGKSLAETKNFFYSAPDVVSSDFVKDEDNEPETSEATACSTTSGQSVTPRQTAIWPDTNLHSSVRLWYLLTQSDVAAIAAGEKRARIQGCITYQTQDKTMRHSWYCSMLGRSINTYPLRWETSSLTNGAIMRAGMATMPIRPNARKRSRRRRAGRNKPAAGAVRNRPAEADNSLVPAARNMPVAEHNKPAGADKAAAAVHTP